MSEENDSLELHRSKALQYLLRKDMYVATIRNNKWFREAIVEGWSKENKMRQEK